MNNFIEKNVMAKPLAKCCNIFNFTMFFKKNIENTVKFEIFTNIMKNYQVRP